MDQPEEFHIPDLPLRLEEKQGGYHMVQDLLAGDSEHLAQLGNLLDSVVSDLCEFTPLHINDPTMMDRIYTTAKRFPSLKNLGGMRFVDSLCSNLNVLVTSTGRLLPHPESERKEDYIAHRSAIKAYTFFLHWIWSQTDRESREGQVATANVSSSSAGSTRGRKKKLQQHSRVQWDWDAARQKIIGAVGSTVLLNLEALFRPVGPPEALLRCFSHLGQWAMRDQALMKETRTREAVFNILCATTLKHRKLEGMAGPLVHLLSDHDHLPQVFADLAAFGVHAYGSDQLAVALLKEIAMVDPESYKEQQSTDAKGLRAAAQFLEKLSEALPHIVVQHVALFAPHLGGEAYTLRSAIVTMFGHCIHRGFNHNGESDERAKGMRVKSKTSLLETLLQRTRDQNAFTRARTLNTWSMLTREASVPMPFMMPLAKVVSGRLHDKASIVRKAAMQLLVTMLKFNPFGPLLVTERFEGTLKDAEAQLQRHKDEAAAAAMADMDVGAVLAGEGCDVHEVEEETREMDKQQDGQAGGENNDGAKLEDASASEGRNGGSSSQKEYEVLLEDLEGGSQTLPYLIASVKVAVAFIREVVATVPSLQQLLASGTVTDTNEAINVIIELYSFRIDGSAVALRSMLPLIFAREESVKKSVVEAIVLLFLRGKDPHESATSLLVLVHGSSVGDLAALEEIVGELVSDGSHMDALVLRALWQIALGDSRPDLGAFGSQSESAAGTSTGWPRGAMQLLSMVARHNPTTVLDNLPRLLEAAFGPKAPRDLLFVSHAADCIRYLGAACTHQDCRGLTNKQMEDVTQALAGCLVSSPLSDMEWFSSAGAAISAMYAVHPEPDAMASAIIQSLADAANSGALCGVDKQESDSTLGLPGSPEGPQDSGLSAASGCTTGLRAVENVEVSNIAEGNNEGDAIPVPVTSNKDEAVIASADASLKSAAASAIALSKLLFTVGQVAMEQLIYIERLTGAIRRQIHEQAKMAAESQDSQSTSQDTSDARGDAQDIGKELGVGANSATADADLDALKESAEHELVSPSRLLGTYVPLLRATCHSRILMDAHPLLRSAATLALAKLMIVDESLCESNLPLIFSLLDNQAMEAAIRSNLVIACGDLFVRFPNALEPWTSHLYKVLEDPACSVRKNALMVVTHLILNDMMKVKGHVSAVAICLEDSDDRIRDLARLFFHELASKSFKNSNPVFSLLPDMLSSLSADPKVATPKFRAIMGHLLTLVSKDRHMDALVEKMCQRLQAASEPARWRDIAFCLSQLTFTEKGLRTLVDSFKLYKHALHEPEVSDAIKTALGSARRGFEKSCVKEMIAEFEDMFAAYVEERQEEEQAAKNAEAHAAGQQSEKGYGTREIQVNEEEGITVGQQSVTSLTDRSVVEEGSSETPVGEQIPATDSEDEEQDGPSEIQKGASSCSLTLAATAKVKTEPVTVKQEPGSAIRRTNSVLDDTTNFA